MNHPCYICGLGSAIPPRVMTNHDLEKLVETSDDWITTRTGIKERHILADGVNPSDCGVEAARIALEEAGVSLEEITHIFVATCTPDYLCPSTACVIAGKLGLSSLEGRKGDVMCLDFNAACTGFVYGLELARSILHIHDDAVVLLVATEGLSRRTNFTDRTTCVLFGDAAGAVVLRANDKNALWQLCDVVCSSDGSLHDLIQIGGGSACNIKEGDSVGADWFISMQGMAVFKYAVRSMAEESLRILARNGMTLGDLDLFIPHQANLRIIKAVGERLGLDEERVFANVQLYGNTSAATLPVAMEDARRAQKLKPGMKVLLTSFGGGMTWGSALLV
ncbi:beta-ketoacyl-ACP synthase III [Mailhella massiliensis]|uniref:Beta-ketoacyl-[acyl-carrier-protein] synthase III n=1 Tax=Mailhella massiliensis TaxID=1903261 RepID=A0A921DQD4_9BACT|nr:beta-ketoacyl-ACP synthase III [Mailhella massiliensis]HJD96395.1 ketoacyl-ACP synthase III [Mailhella massiliensis]